METERQVEFAGFWRRFVALIIDGIIVSLIVFPVALAVGLITPKMLLVEVPFGLFTTTEIVRESPEETEEHNDGSTSIVKHHVEKEEVLGLWENYYEVRTIKSKGETESTKNLIDPNTNNKIYKTTSSDIEFYVIFIYWILLESSRIQGSIGKKIMGIKVVTSEGGKPDIYQAVGRNLLKIVSGMIIFIGFMMAGWTSKKQALHDKLLNMLVVKESTEHVQPVDAPRP